MIQFSFILDKFTNVWYIFSISKRKVEPEARRLEWECLALCLDGRRFYMKFYMKTAMKTAAYGSVTVLFMVYLTYVLALFFRLAYT